MSEDLSLFQLRPAGEDTYRLIFGIGPRSRKVSGIEKIVQMVVKILLTTPGTIPSHPAVGGGLRRLFQEPLDQESVPQIQEELAVAVAFAQEQIVATQDGVELPSDERLRSLGLARVEFDAGEQNWRIDVRLVSESGEEFTLDLSNLLERAET